MTLAMNELAVQACHLDPACGFTKWRIAERDVQRVPVDDCPESWGTRERWLAQVGAS